MQPFLSKTQDWRRPFWLALLIASSIGFTFGFACAVPFAAFSAATALTLPKQDALILTVGVWLANQLTGFLLMSYPWDATTFAWGAALGITGLVSMLAARATALRLGHLHPLLCCTMAFLGAFIVYEASCYVSALTLGGVEDFTLEIQARVFAINACALIGLFAFNRVGSTFRFAPVYNVRSLTQGHA